MPEKYKLKNGQTKWKFRVYLGVNPKTGKQEYTNRQGFNTKAEANRVLRRIKAQVANGTYFKDDSPNKKLTFKDVYSMWLIEHKTQVAPSTLLKIEGMFNNRILPELSKYRINQITHHDIQKLANKWAKYKNNRKWIAEIGRVFRYAQKHDITKNNPTELVTIPKPKEQKESKRFYEKDELNRFLKILNEEENLQKVALLRLLIFTGVRRGEALGLYWENVNFEGKTIEVVRAVRRSADGLYIGETKNKSSKRTISIDDDTLKVLKDLKQYQFNERVFNGENGTILSTSKPRKWLLDIASKANLEPINVHGLRHTHTSLLIEAGANVKEIQYRLGHSNINTTLEVYSHLTERSKEDFAEQFSEYIKARTEQIAEQF